MQSFDRQPRPAEVLLVLDRSGSMENELDTGETRWEAIIPTLVSAIDATSAGIWWGLKTYPELDDTESCAPESIVPTIHVPIAEASGSTVVTAVEATTPLGDGTPTGDAIRFALDHLRERAMLTDNPKFLLLATDGEPNCPDDDDDEDVDAVDYTVDAIAEALAEGFPTFVVGVDTSEDGAAPSETPACRMAGSTRAMTTRSSRSTERGASASSRSRRAP